MLRTITALLFPPKCVLCQQLLEKDEADLCRSCRTHVPEFSKARIAIPFLAQWTAVWYYKDDVRSSILRYKFSNRRSYASAYGRALAMKLQSSHMDQFDVLTWIPISSRRRYKRGFDQVELLARAVADELGITATATLKKVRHTPPQSRLGEVSVRRANILGAFRVINPTAVRDQRVLLLDDIITTGATASEAAKMLRIAGAKEVTCAAVAAATHNHKM